MIKLIDDNCSFQLYKSPRLHFRRKFADLLRCHEQFYRHRIRKIRNVINEDCPLVLNIAFIKVQNLSAYNNVANLSDDFFHRKCIAFEIPSEQNIRIIGALHRPSRIVVGTPSLPENASLTAGTRFLPQKRLSIRRRYAAFARTGRCRSGTAPLTCCPRENYHIHWLRHRYSRFFSFTVCINIRQNSVCFRASAALSITRARGNLRDLHRQPHFILFFMFNGLMFLIGSQNFYRKATTVIVDFIQNPHQLFRFFFSKDRIFYRQHHFSIGRITNVCILKKVILYRRIIPQFQQNAFPIDIHQLFRRILRGKMELLVNANDHRCTWEKLLLHFLLNGKNIRFLNQPVGRYVDSQEILSFGRRDPLHICLLK